MAAAAAGAPAPSGRKLAPDLTGEGLMAAVKSIVTATPALLGPTTSEWPARLRAALAATKKQKAEKKNVDDESAAAAAATDDADAEDGGEALRRLWDDLSYVRAGTSQEDSGKMSEAVGALRHKDYASLKPLLDLLEAAQPLVAEQFEGLLAEHVVDVKKKAADAALASALLGGEDEASAKAAAVAAAAALMPDTKLIPLAPGADATTAPVSGPSSAADQKQATGGATTPNVDRNDTNKDAEGKQALNPVTAPGLVGEILHICLNLASQDSVDCRALVDANIVNAAIQVMAVGDTTIMENGLWLLGNLAGDGPTYRDAVLGVAELQPMLARVARMRDSVLSLQRTFVWTLSNLARGRPAPRAAAVLPVLEVCAGVLTGSLILDGEVVADLMWCVSYCSDQEELHAAILRHGLHARAALTLQGALTNGAVNVITPSLRALGNLVTGDDAVTSQVLELPGFLPTVTSVMNHSKTGLRKEACWTLSNITAGTPQQVKKVLKEPGLVKKAVELATSGEPELAREAVWLLSNASQQAGQGDPEILAILSAATDEEEGTADVAVGLAQNLQHGDERAANVALEGLENILEADVQRLGAGFDRESFLSPVAARLVELTDITDAPDFNTQETAEKYADLQARFFTGRTAKSPLVKSALKSSTG